MKRLLETFKRLVLPVLVGALLFSWYLGTLWIFFAAVALLISLPGIVLNIMYTVNNPARGDKQDYPGFPRKWHRTHMVLVGTTRVLTKRALPRILARPFNITLLKLQHVLFETRTTPLALAESCVYSQFGEDGVTIALFDRLGHGGRSYVEFGVEDGTECCTRVLRERYAWTGLLMDGSHENRDFNLCKEFIDAENIEALLARHGVPRQFDFLVIDIDGNDFYVWDAIRNYSPRVVCIEYNAAFGLADKVVKYNPTHSWDWTNYFGHSIVAVTRLANLKGYSLVHGTLEGVNLYFVRNDLLGQLDDLVAADTINAPAKHYFPNPVAGPWGGHARDPKNRASVTFDEAIEDCKRRR